jgi:hypothetical protein
LGKAEICRSLSVEESKARNQELTMGSENGRVTSFIARSVVLEFRLYASGYL